MKSIVDFINEKQSFLIKGHTKEQQKIDLVDLDLPSGTKWATCNIGANKPEEAGLLFQWGRTDGYKYDDKNHKFLSDNDYVSISGKEYNKNNILSSEDDPATVIVGKSYRTPTAEDVNELIKYTNHEDFEIHGMHGRKFISKKDETKWIFLPAVGEYTFNRYKDYNDVGYYWTSTSLDNNFSKDLIIDMDSPFLSQAYKYDGRTIRPVNKY